MVGNLNAKVRVIRFKFPVSRSKAQYNRSTVTYHVQESRLDDADKETLKMLKNIVSYLPDESSLIKVHPLARVASEVELLSVLGRT